MSKEGAEVEIDEVIVLNKYDGDVSNLSPQALASKRPAETIRVRNGKIVEHINWKEDTDRQWP